MRTVEALRRLQRKRERLYTQRIADLEQQVMRLQKYAIDLEWALQDDAPAGRDTVIRIGRKHLTDGDRDLLAGGDDGE